MINAHKLVDINFLYQLHLLVSFRRLLCITACIPFVLTGQVQLSAYVNSGHLTIHGKLHESIQFNASLCFSVFICLF
jgi:hypothetical protein